MCAILELQYFELGPCNAECPCRIGGEQGLPEISLMQLPENSGRIFLEQLPEGIGNRTSVITGEIVWQITLAIFSAGRGVVWPFLLLVGPFLSLFLHLCGACVLVCACVCVCICMHASYVYVCMYVCMHACMCMCVHVYMCVCMCTYVYVSMYVDLQCVYVCVCTAVWVYVYVCACACVCVYIYIYVCMCIHICMCVLLWCNVM